MSTPDLVNLKAIPMIRRFEYIESYLEGVKAELGREELNASLGEKKKDFEIEKALALGRGNPHRKDINRANQLLRNCIKLLRKMKFVDKEGSKYVLLEQGKRYLQANDYERKQIFAQVFSETYPHLTTIILALDRLGDKEAILPLLDKPKFKPEAEKIGFSTAQMYFDTVRDIATRIGLMNWRVTGTGLERRQHVYLTCKISNEAAETHFAKIRHNGSWLFATPFEVDRNSFRECLWDAYLNLADRIPGSPVFYSSVRENVCAMLKIRDDQFDTEVMKMVDYDEVLHVIWSEGVLQYEKDNASMLKSLPPKNEWGNYVVYLKIVKR